MSEPRTLRSLWTETAEPRSYPPLDGDTRTDVVVVGAGIAGLTTAYLLAKEGRKVLVLDMHELCSGQTGQTTAHLTEFLDARYHTLERDFGREGARVAAASARAAIETIAALVQQLGIACEFERLPAYLYAEKAQHARDLERELEAGRRAGVSLSLTRDVPLPFPVRLALRAESQAQLHPRKYLLGLADAFLRLGGRICEHTRVLQVDDGAPARVHTQRGTVTCNEVVEATTTPLNRVFLHTKLYAYRTYALAGRPARAPARALFYDTEDPYHYVRAAGDLLVIGGEDHKTGEEEDTTRPFARLESWARQRFALTEVTHRWSGQVIEPADGLPYIGRNSLRRHTWVATGFSGTGITFGTVAALVLRDQLHGRDNPFGKLFAATRVKPLAAAMEFVKENAQVGYRFVKDRLAPADAATLAAVLPGEGAIVRLDGKKAAVYRTEAGEVQALSPVCTHLGCHVHWNKAEKSWDCPCHGARYSPSGEVLTGPASRALAALPVPGLANAAVGSTVAPQESAHMSKLNPDAIDLLKAQHKEVEALFEKFEKLEEDDAQGRRTTFLAIADRLSAHTAIEEQFFYPAVKEASTEDLLRESVEEHLAAKRIIADLLDLDSADEQYAAKVKVLQEQVEHHVKEEEKELFPKCRKVMARDQLQDLGTLMAASFEDLMRHEPRNDVPGQTDEAAPV